MLQKKSLTPPRLNYVFSKIGKSSFKKKPTAHQGETSILETSMKHTSFGKDMLSNKFGVKKLLTGHVTWFFFTDGLEL